MHRPGVVFPNGAFLLRGVGEAAGRGALRERGVEIFVSLLERAAVEAGGYDFLPPDYPPVRGGDLFGLLLFKVVLELGADGLGFGFESLDLALKLLQLADAVLDLAVCHGVVSFVVCGVGPWERVTVPGGVKFILAWQRFLVRSRYSVVALAVSLCPAFNLHRVAPCVLTLLYTHNVCLSMLIMHKIHVPILCNLYT